MDYLVYDDQALSPLRRCNNISRNLIHDLLLVLYKLRHQKRFSEPMPWIGIYIAVASLFCILAVVADLIHGLKSRKLWFPCKYFTLNAVSLTVMSVAVKLPMDLTNPMAGVMDQHTKLGSVAFMCVMVAFLLPSLATMNGKELVTNIIALGLLVITLVVNVCIQINTGLVSYSEDFQITENVISGRTIKTWDIFGYANNGIAVTYAAMLLMLLIIYISSALMILKSKQDLESKYQAEHEWTLRVQQEDGQSAVGYLIRLVINYGIMAETGNPQLMTVCSATSSASAVICVSISLLHFIKTLNNLVNERGYKAYDSDYKWSILWILIIQSIGMLLGSIAAVFRFFAPALNLKLSTQGIWNLLMFFKVEGYWTHKLSDWKHSILILPSSNSNFRILFQKLQVLVLRVLALSVKTIVVKCKIIRLFPISILFCIFYCSECVIWLSSLFGVHLDEQQDQDIANCRRYVLQLPEDMEVNDRTIKIIRKYVQHSIQTQGHYSLLMLLLESRFRGFEGVTKFDRGNLEEAVYPNCWSLPVVTLMTIILSLPNIQRETCKSLMKDVSEGLLYVKHVEESFNNEDMLVRVQKAAEKLWLEVQVYHKWLENNLSDFEGKTAIEIVTWFRDKTENMTRMEQHGDICAISMKRITQTILRFDNINGLSQEDLFTELSSMIVDILAACFTNLPKVIALKCHTSVIEKREESVHAAATLLGKTMDIICILEHRAHAFNPDDLPFIDKWREHLPATTP